MISAVGQWVTVFTVVYGAKQHAVFYPAIGEIDWNGLPPELREEVKKQMQKRLPKKPVILH
jgi:hypothetical protein